MNANPIAMKRGRASEYDAVGAELDRERCKPGVICEVRDVFLKATQSVAPDLGKKGHSIQPQ